MIIATRLVNLMDTGGYGSFTTWSERYSRLATACLASHLRLCHVSRTIHNKLQLVLHLLLLVTILILPYGTKNSQSSGNIAITYMYTYIYIYSYLAKLLFGLGCHAILYISHHFSTPFTFYCTCHSVLRIYKSKTISSHSIHIWYIYLHLPQESTKCR